MVNCKREKKNICLPDIVECENFGEWEIYLKGLYENIFVRDFLNTKPTFMGLPVYIRSEPRDGEREHGFIHMTHRDYFHRSADPNDRLPDPRRSERLNWVKIIIEKESCIKEIICEDILYWEEMYRGYVRCSILMKSERFQIVLERRRSYYLLITSFYLEKDYEIKKRLKKYEQYRKQKTPLT